MSNTYLLVVLACLAGHATAQSACQQDCDVEHATALQLCQQTFVNNTASGCDGKCFEIEIRIRNQCVADAIDALEECDSSCDMPTSGPTCPSFMQHFCTVPYAHKVQACHAAFEAATPSSGCDGQCLAAALEARTECLANADAQLEECFERCAATQQNNNDCGCTKEYVPVCGVNGVTYNNRCLAACNSVTSFYPGECNKNELLQERDCGCTKEYVPVCGVDGVTYNNQCLAVCNLVTRFYPGECSENELLQKQDCGCTEEYVPVCGVDGITYDNVCLAACNRMTRFFPGECSKNELLQKQDCGCTEEYVPVCGVDGITYSNRCLAVCNLMTRFYPGECSEN